MSDVDFQRIRYPASNLVAGAGTTVVWKNNLSTIVRISPGLEQEPAYDAVNLAYKDSDGTNTTVCVLFFQTFVCPSDPRLQSQQPS